MGSTILKPLHFCICVAFAWMMNGAAFAEDGGDARERLEASSKTTIGGPQTAPAQLEEDRLRKQQTSRLPGLDAVFDPLETAKQDLRAAIGLDLGFDYQAAYQLGTSSVTGIDEGAAGHARLIGNWTLFGRESANPGKLVFILENRHRIGSQTTAAGLASNIGYFGVTGTTFSDSGNSLTVAHWAQTIADGQGGIVAGRIDPTDYIDILGYVNPRTTFSNLAILYNPVIPLPDQGFGIAGGVHLTEQVYVLGMITDANGSITDIKWFPGGAEFFKYAEIGWTPAKNQRFLTNFHISGFHVDKREKAGVPASYGVVASGNITFDNTLMLFGRLGASTGDAPIANLSGTAGLMWRPGFYDDLVGLSVNVAKPSLDGSSAQTTLETFYRFDLADNFAITADAQWLINPAFDPNSGSVGVFGLRARFNL
ncbi:MAG: carbohydrate porin [Hyphomicrobiales bacterium]